MCLAMRPRISVTHKGPGLTQGLCAFVYRRVAIRYNNVEGFPFRRESFAMTQLIFNDEQVETVRQATERLEVRDRGGNLVAYLAKQPGFSPTEIAEAKRRMSSGGPWRTTQQVLARLHALPERLPATPAQFIGKFSREETYSD